MTTTTAHPHADWCQPRPDEDAPRMETDRVATYSHDGSRVVGAVVRVRCLECAEATYDGIHRQG